ncbi:hypothetical protein N8972_00080 [Sulfurospirillum sp.]|nr:hypothetical protein [Sulfurospirillum sp.]
MLNHIFLVFILSIVTLNANNFKHSTIAYKKSDYSDTKAFLKVGVVDDKSITYSYMLERTYLNRDGLKEGLRKKVPHCKTVLKQYHAYNFPNGFNFENTTNY